MRWLLAPAFILTAAWWLWSQFAPISRVPGVLVRNDPEQQMYGMAPQSVQMKGWTLKPLASYKVQGRVLSKAHYSDDAMGGIAPYDLALGWGAMSDTAVLKRLDIRQVYRYYEWACWSPELPLPRAEITGHSANVHVIPATDQVLAKVRRLRKGSLVILRGDLVEASLPGQKIPMRSSLVRTDSGDGACEIMLVRSVQELD